MSSKYQAMQFAARLTVVGRLLSDMYGVLALLTVVPTAVALVTESVAAPIYIGVVLAFASFFLSGRLLPEPERVQKNEALLVVALLFISSSLFFALPIMAYDIDFVDAWFEAVSGVTTTGLSTLSVENAPAALLFGRAWMQWLGGIGVVVLALAIFVRPGVIASRLGFSDREMDDVVGGTRAHARRVVVIYLLLTAAGVAALYLSGASILDAIVHCMAAVSTGGFSNYDDSLALISDLRLLIVNLLCMAGAISFYLYYRSLFFMGRKGFFNSQLNVLVVVMLAGLALVALLQWLAGNPLATRDLLTLVVSAQTTAGFSTFNLSTLSPATMVLLCMMMAIGGGAGSTSGGIKVDRFVTLWQVATRALLRVGVPDQVYLSAEGPEGRAGVNEAVALLLWTLLFMFLSWMMFLVYGYAPVASLFEVTSALATTGLSAGITSPELPTTLKIVLTCNMLLGRLEIVAILVLFAPHSWIGRRRGKSYIRSKS